MPRTAMINPPISLSDVHAGPSWLQEKIASKTVSGPVDTDMMAIDQRSFSRQVMDSPDCHLQ